MPSPSRPAGPGGWRTAPVGSLTSAPVAVQTASIRSSLGVAVVRTRAATPATRALARAIPAVIESKGPTPSADIVSVSAARPASGESGPSVMAISAAPASTAQRASSTSQLS